MPSSNRKPLRESPATAASLRKLAEACGVSPTAASKWLDHESWPFARKAPWNIEAVKKWRLSTLSPDPAADPGHHEPTEPVGLQKAKLLLTLERAKSVRQKREIEAGLFISVDESERREVARIGAVKSAMFALARSAPAEMVGRTVEEMGEILHRKAIEICNDFADAKATR